jgi:hypothetical protein
MCEESDVTGYNIATVGGTSVLADTTSGGRDPSAAGSLLAEESPVLEKPADLP